LRPGIALILLSVALSGCFSLGPRALKADQVDYARALGGGETRPIVLIHAGKKIQGSVHSAVSYRGSRFWIDDADFDSKYALTVVHDLMALAEQTDTSHAPLVTVPAN